jgi:hypothetical protein
VDPVSNVDRLVLLLRQRLQERDRTRGPARKADARAREASGGGVAAARALAALEDVDERQLRRALIQGLLSDQLGRQVLNEPRFQQVVDRVVTAIEGDEGGRALLDRISREMRAAGR